METSNDEDDRREDCDAADADHHFKLQLHQFHQPTRLNAEDSDDIDMSRKNPGSVSYVSPEIQNEFISILASTVRNHLLSDIKRNTYFRMMFDFQLRV